MSNMMIAGKELLTAGDNLPGGIKTLQTDINHPIDIKNLEPGIYVSLDFEGRIANSYLITQESTRTMYGSELLLRVLQKYDDSLADGTVFAILVPDRPTSLPAHTFTRKSTNSRGISDGAYSEKYVVTSSDQTINSKKTFTVLPESQKVPTIDEQFTNKQYVDTLINSKIVYWDGQSGTVNPANITLMQEIVDFILANPTSQSGSTRSTVYPILLIDYSMGYGYIISKVTSGSTTSYNQLLSNFTANSGSTDTSLTHSNSKLNLTLDADFKVTTVSPISISSISKVLSTTVNYSTPYMPISEGSPATKKYVDDTISLSNLGVKTFITSQSTPVNIKDLTPGIYIPLNEDGTLPGLRYMTTNNDSSPQFFSGNAFLIVMTKWDTSLADNTIFATTAFKAVTNAGSIPTNFAKTSSGNGVQQSTSASQIMDTISVQTVTAKKAFNVLPETTIAPTTDNQFTNKAYVDSMGANNTGVKPLVTSLASPAALKDLTPGIYIPIDENGVAASYLYLYTTSDTSVSNYSVTGVLEIVKKYDETMTDNTLIGVLHPSSLSANDKFYRFFKVSSGNGIQQSYINNMGMYTNAVQTVTSKHSYDVLPESAVIPTTDNQFVNKKYVDDKTVEINVPYFGWASQLAVGTPLTAEHQWDKNVWDSLSVGSRIFYPSPFESGVTLHSILVGSKQTTGYKAEGGRYWTQYYYYSVSTSVDEIAVSFDLNGNYVAGNSFDAGGGGGGQACFTADTLISTPSGMIPICELNVGDEVYTLDKNYTKISKPIMTTYKHNVSDIIEISIGRETFKASRTHPFLTRDRGRLTAEELKVNEVVYDKNGIEHIIHDLKVVPVESETVYEIRPYENMNYLIGTQEIFVYCENI